MVATTSKLQNAFPICAAIVTRGEGRNRFYYLQLPNGTATRSFRTLYATRQFAARAGWILATDDDNK